MSRVCGRVTNTDVNQAKEDARDRRLLLTFCVPGVRGANKQAGESARVLHADPTEHD
jgi:hypothetical protein